MPLLTYDIFICAYERRTKIVPAGITKITTITPHGFWPDLRRETLAVEWFAFPTCCSI